MSTDTSNENASVVDSSVTHKHEVGTLDGPGSSSPIEHDDSIRSAAEARCLSEKVDNTSTTKGGEMYSVRYFIIKSLSYDNIQLSIEKGIWATQVGKEPTLDEAFHNSSRVILIFSVNMSGAFQGYAQMMSPIGWRKDRVWGQGMGGNCPWGRSFSVKWLQLNNLPFHKTAHLRNPLNEYKPVKISRDCQELPPEIGDALCELIDKEINMVDSFEGNGDHVSWPVVDSSYTLPDGGYNSPMSQMTWGGTPMLYPFAFQRQQVQLSKPSLVSQGSAGVCHQAKAPPYGIISEEEFLEMSYEEYLEAHRNDKRSCHQVAVPARKKLGPSSKGSDDESTSLSGQSYPRKRSRQQSIE